MTTATATTTAKTAAPRDGGGALPGYVSDTLALAGRHLVHLRRSPGRLVLVTMNPLVMLIAIGYLFRESMNIPGNVAYEDFIMAGIAIQVGLTSVGPTAIGVAMDLRNGLVDRFRSLPIASSTVLIGRTLSDLFVGAVSLTAVSLVGLGVGWRPHNGFLQTLAGFGVLLAFIYTMLWLGILLGTAMKNVEAIDGSGALVLVILSFLSNAYVGVGGLPGWLQPIAEWNPVTSVITTTRRLWGNDPVGATGTGFPSEHPGLVTAIMLTTLLVVSVFGSLRGFRKAVGN
ncbi:ABC transporter permease [Streptomyces alfalfae]|uniref:Transport permease protein n=1 Tax=Streptomyces alfalfae TaxID=1642299 RepID=A0A1P8THS4_9ACTN|nr:MULTISPECIES: ABC transporter permease [Streptomyces]AYA17518.1 ABC transporter permease [Streptomyces fradiae]APY87119.1 ABC transporter [Streptomyces alfalfae]KUL60446.1 ABC transporter [Streptomyces sp. NRRL S-1521]QQC90615.1 ABC transporter permease [Streptomyces alfalfae]QUI33098.1 ABC transporter permease [Streptomyces alfalfae]